MAIKLKKPFKRITKVESLDKLYADRVLYTSQDMFSPPSERLPHVIRFELTTGCNWSRCTYCGGFDGIKHRVKTPDEYKEHVDAVFEKMHPNLKQNLRRIFIGGGNALEVETETLIEALEYTANRFIDETRRYPRRISLYGRTDSIQTKGSKDLDRLYRAEKYGFNVLGLNLIYWGVESGSTSVLEYANKGCTEEDILDAARKVRESPVDTSVMIMPGLGGKKYYEEHISETVHVLGKIQPNFLTFMGINPSNRSAYAKKMQREIKQGTNQPLTPYEMALQMIAIIRRIPIKRKMKIGCFDSRIDGVGCNPLTFGSYNLYENYDSKRLAENLEYSYRLEQLKQTDDMDKNSTQHSASL